MLWRQQIKRYVENGIKRESLTVGIISFLLGLVFLLIVIPVTIFAGASILVLYECSRWSWFLAYGPLSWLVSYALWPFMANGVKNIIEVILEDNNPHYY